jgi:hypothetical protein
MKTMTTIDAIRSTTGVTAATVDAAPSAAPPTLIPDPLTALLCSGDPGAEIAALAVKTGETQQNTAQAARDADEQLEATEDGAEVDAMRKKADEIRSAGWADGVGMFAEGASAVAGAYAPTPQANAVWKGLGTGVHASLSVGSSYTKAAEADRDADSAAHKASADQARRAADDMHDAKKAGSDFVSAACDFYKEYTSAKDQANSAALHRA